MTRRSPAIIFSDNNPSHSNGGEELVLRETFRSLAARGWRCLLTYHECGGLIPEYVRIGQSGREIVREQFGLSRYLDQFEDLVQGTMR